MKKDMKVPWRLLLSLLIFGGLFASMVWLVSVLPVQAAPDATPIVDGVVDAVYGAPLASDPAGDGNGNAAMDLLDLYMTDDVDYFYIAFTVNEDLSATNWGKYMFYVDTTNDANGATSDAWGRNVVVNDPHKPEFSLNTYVDSAPYGPEDIQFWTWNQGTTSWSQVGSVAEAALGTGATSTLEWKVAKSEFGNPDTIWVEVWSTGNGGGDNAQDTINDPADDWNATDWSTTAVLANSTAYQQQTVPVAPVLVVDSPTEGQRFASPDIQVQGNATSTLPYTVTVNVNSAALFTPTLTALGDFSQPVTLAVGDNTITVTAVNADDSSQVVRNVQFGASHDNNVWWNELGHDSRDGQFRTPSGPVITGTAVTLRLRAAMNDLTEAKVRVYNDLTNAEFFLPMSIAASDGTYDWWEATLPATAEPTLFWYRFIAIDGTSTAYYEDDGSRDGGWGETMAASQDNSWQLTIYDPSFQTPDWVKNAIIYQIFPDRFRDGDPSNNPAPGRFFYDELDGTIFRSDPDGGTSNPWNEVICDPRDAADCPGTYSLNFYGGDLQGVHDKLQYLQDLGVTTIYFNPIFESPSNHKYDTGNYYDIASDFGDLSTFITLTTEAHNLGMKVILDGVFNHTSSDSMFFDRYSRFDADGNLTSPGGSGTNDGSGACESPSSPYRDWYYFTDVPAGTGDCAGSDGTPLAANYESWFGYDSLPKLDAANPGVRDMIFAGGEDSVAVRWLEHADGWRFDVGGDIDPGRTNDPTNLFWEAFRATVRAEYPETYMVIEEWGNASPWLLGNEMDATMNYQYGAAMLSFWRDTTFTDNDHNSGSSVGELVPLTPSQLNGRLLNWIERYPPEALYAMMNLIDSHDTNRALFLLDDNAADANDDSLLQDPNYDWSNALARLRGVAILQMTLPGAPTIYYGDEVGLVGPTYFSGGKWEDDPYNRQPYPWLDEGGTPFYTFLQSQSNQDEMYDYYANLTDARNTHEALRLGSFDPLLIDDAHMIYAYGRKMADNSDVALVLLNRDGTLAAPISHTVPLTVAGYVPFGAQFTDVMSGNSYTVDGSGVITVTVPGQSGAVLVLDAPITTAPDAVTDLAVTGQANTQIDLGWTAVSGNVTYHIYRSLTSGGGYDLIGSTDNLVYSDTGLQNATTYYYRVVVENKDTGLLSEPSNEVSGQPQHDLTAAFYNLQWPYEITHTISALTPTENIYGQLYIAGFTGGNGPAAGIRVQVGYGPLAAAPSAASWHWTEMSYDSAQGNNDQYVGTLLPDMVGEFLFTTRWSSDNGQTWLYADRTGPGYDAADAGELHVVASADTTAPAATTLALDGTTAGSISLSWALNSEPDMAGYELYRQNIATPGFSKIATTAVISSYVDTDVVTGETYDYYLKAFDTSFNRSPASNTVQATAEARFVDVTFRVAVPEYTPGTVYIVGDIDEWGPWNPGKAAMTQVGSSNVWTYTLPILDGTQLQYKYTRGSWETVESWGSIIALNNRQLTISYGDDGTMLVDNTATDWGNGPDDGKAVQTWRDPIVLDYGPVGTEVSVGTAVTTSWSITMSAGSEFEVVGPDGPVTGTFALSNNSRDLTFMPDEALDFSTTYTVTVAGLVGSSASGAESGTQQVPVAWQFTTEKWRLWLPIIFKN